MSDSSKKIDELVVITSAARPHVISLAGLVCAGQEPKTLAKLIVLDLLLEVDEINSLGAAAVRRWTHQGPLAEPVRTVETEVGNQSSWVYHI